MIFFEHNIEAVAKGIKNAQKQVVFATRNALNKTAKEVQKQTLSNIKEKFSLRGSWFRPGTRFGFNIKFATKSDPTARFGSAAPWMEHQEEAGIKRVPGKRLSVITEFLRGSKLSKVTSVKKASVVMAKKHIFTIKLANQNEVVMRRPKRTGEATHLFTLTESVKIKKVWHFKRDAQAFVNKIYSRIFDQELKNAIKTAK